MLNFYQLLNGKLQDIKSFQKDCLINLHNPTPEEIDHLCDLLNINKSVILRILDIEESSRIDIRDNYILSSRK